MVVTTWGVLLGRPGEVAGHPTSQKAALTVKKVWPEVSAVKAEKLRSRGRTRVPGCWFLDGHLVRLPSNTETLMLRICFGSS